MGDTVNYTSNEWVNEVLARSELDLDMLSFGLSASF